MVDQSGGAYFFGAISEFYVIIFMGRARVSPIFNYEKVFYTFGYFGLLRLRRGQF